MAYDLVFQFPTSCAKIKVKGQLIQKAKMKTIKVGKTRPIAVRCRLVIVVVNAYVVGLNRNVAVE